MDRFVGIGLVRPDTVRPVSGVWASSLSRPDPPRLAAGLAFFVICFAGRRVALVVLAVFLTGRLAVFLTGGLAALATGRLTTLRAAFTGRLALRRLAVPALARALVFAAVFVVLAFAPRAETVFRALVFAIFFLAITCP
ncbi:MAG TPA: hypothetical protein VNJ03_15645 [Vicinamibacterales bacterium]|nr:hypothetical protein [Vicinamibacterales bacterium]